MKLNPDCLRDILFYLEEHLDINSDLEILCVDIYAISNSLDYPIGEIANTLLVLNDADFINCHYSDADDVIDDLDVYRITYDGYEFIEHIRPKPVWDKVKGVCTNIEVFSIDVISKVAVDVITQFICAKLNLQ